MKSLLIFFMHRYIYWMEGQTQILGQSVVYSTDIFHYVSL